MHVLLSALNIVLVLGSLVIAHELGHFLVAKWCGMRVEDFSLFFGPRIWRIGTFGGTEYNIRSIPLGGYVKIAGMEPDDLVLGAALLRPTLSTGKPSVLYGLSQDDVASLDESKISDRLRVAAESAVAERDSRMTPEGREELNQLLLSSSITEEERKYLEILLKADKYTPDPMAFNQRPIWQRALTIAAGPAASLIFSLLVFVGMGVTTGLPELKALNVIGRIADPKSPAALAGLKPGDQIVQIDQTPVHDGPEMVTIIHKSAGKLLTLHVLRSGKTLLVPVTPQLGNIDGKQVGLIGFAPDGPIIYKRYSPVAAVGNGIDIFRRQVTGMLGMIFSKDIAKNTGGIIRIGAVIHEDSSSFVQLLLTSASLSISLGIVNLFPIPVLDGGHLMLLGWEAARRRKLTSREVMTAQICGLSIIGVLFVLITCKDFFELVLPRLIRHG